MAPLLPLPRPKPKGGRPPLDDRAALSGYTLVIYGWGKGHGMPVEQLTNYAAFKNRMLQRPTVRKVLEREESQLLSASQ